MCGGGIEGGELVKGDCEHYPLFCRLGFVKPVGSLYWTAGRVFMNAFVA